MFCEKLCVNCYWPLSVDFYIAELVWEKEIADHPTLPLPCEGNATIYFIFWPKCLFFSCKLGKIERKCGYNNLNDIFFLLIMGIDSKARYNGDEYNYFFS